MRKTTKSKPKTTSIEDLELEYQVNAYPFCYLSLGYWKNSKQRRDN